MLSFTIVYFLGSSLSNGLRPIQTKKFLSKTGLDQECGKRMAPRPKERLIEFLNSNTYSIDSVFRKGKA